MPAAQLSETELLQLIDKVFQPQAPDNCICFLTDVPNQVVPDDALWQERRQLAWEWANLLTRCAGQVGLAEVSLYFYENVGSNNADLPERAFAWSGAPRQADARVLRKEGKGVSFEDIFAGSDILLVPSKFSATAPLKNAARKYGFRAASMPGFTRAMIPTLSLDYDQVHQRVMRFKSRLDRATAVDMRFAVGDETLDFHADLRHRTGHASSGLLREPGVAGNLPSGEAFIVPYEGELEEESQTAGRLPVQFGDEVVIYEIKRNRAVAVVSSGEFSNAEKGRLQSEPAYGNIAEIGFGVLEPFGIKPVGETLLDEKLGLHIAFGRSDHFGGATSPAEFRKAENVVHIDYIYLPEFQPKVQVQAVVFRYEDDTNEAILRDNRYLI